MFKPNNIVAKITRKRSQGRQRVSADIQALTIPQQRQPYHHNAVGLKSPTLSWMPPVQCHCLEKHPKYTTCPQQSSLSLSSLRNEQQLWHTNTVTTYNLCEGFTHTHIVLHKLQQCVQHIQHTCKHCTQVSSFPRSYFLSFLIRSIWVL